MTTYYNSSTTATERKPSNSCGPTKCVKYTNWLSEYRRPISRHPCKHDESTRHPDDGQRAKAKVQYYLGAFVGYFLYLYLLLRYGKATAARLYDSSYQSESHARYCASMVHAS